MKTKELNAEICFTISDFDAFLQILQKRNDIMYLHKVHIHPWGQRVVRLFDLDMHLIEIGESLQQVALRFLQEGKTIAKISKLMDISIADVKRIVEENSA